MTEAVNEKKGWKWWQILFAVIAGLIVLGALLPDPDRTKMADGGSEAAVSLAAAGQAEVGAAEQADEVVETQESRLTGPQRNAVRSAEQYLSMSGFSRAGLIDQLSSEYGNGYSVSDATVAVDSLNVDWNQQAVRSAQQYLEMTGFSCSGLIEQLSSEYGNKYTRSQASYGAHQAGAC